MRKPLFDIGYPRVDLHKVPGFRYRGGKFRLRRWLIRWCPLAGSTFVEPFAGRANMYFLMRQVGKFQNYVLNDKRTIPFFRSILNYDGTPFQWPDEDEFWRAGEDLRFMEPCIFWDGSTATRVNGKKGSFKINESQGRIVNPKLYRRKILRIQAMLKQDRVNFSEDDACAVIDYYAWDKDAFLYIDPPYLKASVDAYDDKMLDRKDFIRTLKDCRARWMLSEYYCQDLVEAFGEPVTRIRDWKIVAGLPEDIKKNTGKHRTVDECVWTNYPAKPCVMDLNSDEDYPMRMSLRL
jgi:site-specific DNA-adenine methylase